MWDQLPSITSLALQLNRISGFLPAPSSPRFLVNLVLSGNAGLTGTYPPNLTAEVLSLSHTGISGSLALQNYGGGEVKRVSIAFTQITCLLLLPDSVQHLEMLHPWKSAPTCC
jgi:hypothetical protein